MNIVKENMDIEIALAILVEKYGIQTKKTFHLSDNKDDNSLQLMPGNLFENGSPGINQIPLLTWRYKRKFTELKKIVDDAVIQDVCLYRFSQLGDKDKSSLFSLLYREMDLLEYIGNSKILSVQAVISDDQVANVILRLENNSLGSIEVSSQMPSGSQMVERHEIIARRGVTSDLVVDTQIPQSSIYTFTNQGENRYTDVDNELFGLEDSKIDHVRSAFQVLKNPDLQEKWRQQHHHLCTLVKMVFDSNNNHKRIFLNHYSEN